MAASTIERSPELFAQTRLLAEDFDGTIAKTFEPSPGGVDVHVAYEFAIDELFGPGACDVYRQNGGLRNRAPREVVTDLVGPEEEAVVTELTDRLVGAKLGVLVSEIGRHFDDGSVWPRPVEGYLDLRSYIEKGRQDGRLVDEAIISSGHQPFIAATYAAWGLTPPEIIVASEITTAHPVYRPEQLIKPAPELMEVARDLWRTAYGLIARTDEERERMWYVGDDPVKDGELARNSGIWFTLIDPINSAECWRQIVAPRLGLGMYRLEEVAE